MGIRDFGYALIFRRALLNRATKQKRIAENIVCLFAAGDSMTHTIQDKSLVAINVKDKTKIHDNKICAVQIPDEGVTINRARRRGDHMMLFGDNQNFQRYPRCLYLKK
jgi:SOS-response transcriptional repressor LexA